MNTAEYSGICKWMFRFGVYDLPLKCKSEPLHTLPSTSSENRTQSFEKVSFPNVSLRSDLNAESMTYIASGVDFSNLYPAIIECFAIILCGYLAGRANWISQTEAKGLNVFVGTFSLPSLIFLSMAKLDFSTVNWMFLCSIAISKTIVFFLVLLITLLVYRPVNFGCSGLYAVFCTQSNDFALGYPIVAALYGKVHPDFASYLYLIAPISFVLLNPIGYIFMEIEKRRNPDRALDTDSAVILSESVDERSNKCRAALNIGLDFLMNPFVFMTVFGIGANFIFHHHLPLMLDKFLMVFGNAFSATALFLLGLSMVGKVQNLKGSYLVAPGILISVKTVLLPLVTREVITLLKPGGDNANITEDFSNFGFLYSTFPTAPGVFVLASKYEIAVDMIASALVACTFLSAPLMFISAKMVTLVSIDPKDYLIELQNFLYNVSIIGLFCSVWVCLVFIITSKWKKVPHFITLYLTISQSIACIGALIWSMGLPDYSWVVYLQFVIFSYGVFASRIWTAMLALNLFLLSWRSTSFVIRFKHYITIVGWIIPGIIVLLILIVEKFTASGSTDPNFQYGSAQAIFALLLLWFCLFSTVAFLILHERYKKKYSNYEAFHSNENFIESGSAAVSPHDSPTTSRSFLINGEPRNEECTDSLRGSDESLFSYDDRHIDRHNQTDIGVRHSSQLTEPEEIAIVRDRDDEHQLLRHVVLLLLLCGSMVVGFSLCMWSLVSPVVNGVYVELVFLDVVLNFGQSVFTAIVFGLEFRVLLAPLTKKWRWLMYGSPTINLPNSINIDTETKQTCEQFTKYHLDKCTRDIVRDRNWRLKEYPSVFAGKELVDWLLLVGLCNDRTDAVKYGRRLLMGRIIRHVEDLHHFHDQALLYTFIDKE